MDYHKHLLFNCLFVVIASLIFIHDYPDIQRHIHNHWMLVYYYCYYYFRRNTKGQGNGLFQGALPPVRVEKVFSHWLREYDWYYQKMCNWGMSVYLIREHKQGFPITYSNPANVFSQMWLYNVKWLLFLFFILLFLFIDRDYGSM